MCLPAQCGNSANGHGVQIEGGSFHNIVANCTFVNIAPPAQMHAVVLAGEGRCCKTRGFCHARADILWFAASTVVLCSALAYTVVLQ